MGGEDLIDPPDFSKSEYMSENDGLRGSTGEADSLPLNSEEKIEINREASEGMPDDTCHSGFEASESEYSPVSTMVDGIIGKACGSIPDSSKESIKAHMTTNVEKDAVNDTDTKHVDLEMTEQVAVVNAVVTDNGSVALDSEIILTNHKQNGTSISGVKRPRISVDEHQPSVRVIYSSLTRESKRKLEELLQQWSRWHGQNCSASNDSNSVTESGEETYFPALRVGLDKPSQVTFWVDNQTKGQSNKEFIPLDGTSVPLYDRGYALALTSGDGSSGLIGEGEKLGESRCFNCSSYGHGLKDCPMPRDNAAVSSARKQHRSQRNQSANSRNSARYYQSSRGGKYEGLAPGVLDPETRQLLGIGELDPPPWLNRMREIGYPPGYLDPDVEDQPSGITIFGDEPSKEEGEEGEIVGAISPKEPTRKMSVEFPGINAPIPANANERLWAASSSDSTLPRERSHHRGHNFFSENPNRVHHDTRWSADLDDERPPGTDPWTSPSLANHFRRHGDYDRETSFSPLGRFDRYNDYDRDSSYMSHSPRAPSSWSPSYIRSLSDRGRRSPLAQDEYRQYGSYPHSYPR